MGNRRFWLAMPAAILCAIAYAGAAQAITDGCGANKAQCTKFKDQKPKTLQTINVTARYIPPPKPTPPPLLIDVSSFSSGYPPDYLARPSNYYASKPKNDKGNVNCNDYTSDPIEISKQAKIESMVLFALPGEMGLKYELDYVSTGSGWTDNLAYELDPFCGGQDQCYVTTLTRPDGSRVTFHGSYAGTYQGHTEVGGGGLATLDHNADGTYVVHDEDGTTQTYNAYASLIGIKDESGVGWTLSYGSGTVTVTDSGGRSFTIASHYNSTTFEDTDTITDPAGHTYQFVATGGGDIPGRIYNLTLPGTPTTVINYKYGTYGLTETDYNGVPYSYTTYDSNGRATGNRLADNTDATSIVYSFPASGQMTAVITNPLGHTTTNQYNLFVDPSGAGQQYMLSSTNESAVSDCGATDQSFAYDSDGNPTKVVDNDGHTHTYSYAANGQLQTETEASGTSLARKTDYVWDPVQQLQRLSSVTVEGETKTSYAYNAQNRLASVTQTNLTGIGTASQSLTSSYAYTLYGNGTVKTATITQPSPGGSDHTTYAYDSYGDETSVTDGLGHVTSFSNYNGLGEVGKIVGPNGDETDYTYDARGRVATKTTHPNGGTATWTYAYDGFGLLAKVTAPDSEVTTWTRDAEQRVKTITHNDKDGTSTETFTYDANNDVTSDLIARGSDVGSSTSYAYDGLGRIYQVKGSHGQVLTYAYDGNGNVLSVTDALGHKTRYAYDALNRVIGVTNAANGVTSYTYDADDHVIGVEDPRGLVTSYDWDGLGQLWEQVSPDTGITHYSYDAYGRLSSFTRADGTVTSLGYDALNRRTTASAGGLTRTNVWDTCTNGKGRLCAAVVNGYDSVSYAYTPQGWITARTFSISGGPNYSVSYGYDNMGRLAVVDYPDGNQALYYYTDGAVSKINLQVGTYLLPGVTNITYRPMDLAMSGWTSYNGLSNSITYDSDLRPMSITVPGVEDLSFDYDTTNRITTITNGLDSTQSETLDYDALDRLTSMASTGENESYQYDADGNRVSQVINGTTSSFAYPTGSNRLTSVSGGLNGSFGYNANGDTVTVNGNADYTYDPFERIVNARGTTFVISAEGQRLEKNNTVDGITYFVPGTGGTLLAENQNGTWMDYVWLNGRVVTVVANGGVFPIATDQTGRPLALTDPTSGSQIDWAADGLPFDRTVTSNHWGNFNIGFPGQYYDQEDNLWYNGARDYNETLGRYMESDPIGLAGGVNTYAYVGDNPITGTDPLGLEGPGSWTYPAGSPDGLDYQRAKAGCYDTQAEGLLLAAITIAAMGGPEDPAADAAAAAEMGFVDGTGVTVLGSYPEYIELAQQLGANYFSVPMEEWGQMSAAEQWAANQAFLDQAIARGDSFVFSNEFAPAGSSFERELQYLQQRNIFTATPPAH